MAKKDDTALVETRDHLPTALAAQFLADADDGMEDAGADAYAIPFVALLQSGSPQVKRGSGAQLEGAAEGMIFNTVSEELFDGDEGIDVVPVYYRQAFVEWVPRDSGGGFVQEFAPGEEPPYKRDEDTGRDKLGNGNDIVDTRYHYCLLLKKDGSFEPVVITMTSTQVKKSRRWMFNIRSTQVGGKRVKMHGQVWNLRSVTEQKDQYTWCNWATRRVGFVQTEEVYNAAIAFYAAVKAGELKENPELQNVASADLGSSDRPVYDDAGIDEGQDF